MEKPGLNGFGLKVLRCHSSAGLKVLVEAHEIQGWERVGHMEVFGSHFVQPMRMLLVDEFAYDVTEEITQREDDRDHLQMRFAE